MTLLKDIVILMLGLTLLLAPFMFYWGIIDVLKLAAAGTSIILGFILVLGCLLYFFEKLGEP